MYLETFMVYLLFGFPFIVIALLCPGAARWRPVASAAGAGFDSQNKNRSRLATAACGSVGGAFKKGRRVLQ